ncbi:DNA mismatch repair endonuclease MutL [Nitrosococcus watsonii]|uniref:DNA mismatch repair protein MutL n=1 Tax=Nitrosococcus watsoni (strain C-113) TaxID=105559 RepID=D8KAV8_NITWC|nr:DNA mismatch repair endonuclease MutL [Nitrosococcus watsonii]ADJ29535.1 DNA mismatch repair protein MutL [Nitrosococcus watsonii C-113]
MAAPSIPRIQILPPALANQIAAGEVVERPASVLKELVENALDAGAQRIEIEAEVGGIGLIRVRDDGCGIHHDDLPMALSPHATSKIHHEEELLNITTLGFRGEALASIGAVSRLSLCSRIADSEHGWCVRENTPAQPIAHPVGTTVEARDLFYNTPARRRFLRGEKTEFIRLRTIQTQLALSHFEISFRISYNRRPFLTLPACARPLEQLKRITELCGRTFTEHSMYFKRETEGLCLWGWLGHPEFARSQTDLQYCYVNHRMVRDKLLRHAARQAYGDRLPQGRHPSYLLYLELPTHQIDVNAHPTKHEVRFRESRRVHGFIVRTLAEILERTEPEEEHRLVSGEFQPQLHDMGNKGQADKTYPIVAEPSENYSPLKLEKRTSPSKERNEVPSRLGQVQALVLGRYLLAENKQGLVLVDLPVARAHLAQAYLRTAYTTGHIIRQPLLLPLTFQLSLQQAAWTEQHAPELRELGLGLHQLGPQTVILREIPAAIQELDLKGLLLALFAQITRQQHIMPANKTPLRELIVDLTARYPASTVSRPSLQEMNALLQELENLYQTAPRLDPSPWRELSKHEIEQWFLPS